ncbi:HTH-type transcriptional activator RhaS [Paenibacillus solanacearum]|uniref:HTH-type transcriptional activator RhaS n=1 Tax=Paenibacillus solanacearum TaxID=2048548 RepID=A0A916K160_9BACL|nr:AraC family transcriptional regulator [Paenibacillus solanacearum]CAG7621473.1 HTH-type transcriptional activator RhaS [Paenibacillus solanacearum]
MTIYPEYQDTLEISNVKKGQLPFYIRRNTIDTSYHLHHHDFAEFSVVVGGTGTETINGVTHPLESGTVTLLPPNQMHKFRCDSEPLQIYCCMFDTRLLFESQTDAELGQLLLQSGERYPYYCTLRGDRAERMFLLCKEMFTEYQEARIGKFSGIRAKLIEGLLLFFRSQLEASPGAVQESFRDDKRWDWDIIQHVHKNYLEKLTLEELSAKFGVSPAYISRLFKKLTGCGFLEYLHTLRIRRASSLLLLTDMAITDVSSEAGFESLRTFWRVFKEMKRMTPGEFRQLYGHDTSD